MRKLHFLIFVLFSFVFPVPIAAQASTTEVTQRISQDVAAMDNFIEGVNTAETSSDLDEIVNSAPSLQSQLLASSSYYETSGYPALSSGVKQISSAVGSISSAITAGDSDAVLSAIDDYNSGLETFNRAVDQINASSGSEDYGGLLGFLLLVSIILSAVLLLQSLIGNKLLRAEEIRNKYQFELFLGSLVPLAGSLISFVWYSLTPPGGTYYTLWGLIAFGYLAFVGSAYNYFTNTRPKINALKKQEMSKIRAVLDK